MAGADVISTIILQDRTVNLRLRYVDCGRFCNRQYRRNRRGGIFRIWQCTSMGADVPSRLVVPRADFNFITGTGRSDGLSQTSTDPIVDISWSEDGGATFKMPIQRALGRGGKNGQVGAVLQTGQTSRYGRVWKLKVSDPVYVGLLSATMGVGARMQSQTPIAAMTA